MFKNQKGFSAVEFLLVILVIAVIGFGGYYVYHTQHKTQSTTNASKTVASTGSTVQTANFYTCVNNKGTLATTGNASCKLNGKTYTFPTSFSSEDITNYDKVPSAAQPLVLSLAQKNFDGFDSCVKNSQTPDNAQGTYPNVIVSIAGSKFVIAAVNSCDNGYSEEFGLTSGDWSDLGVESPASVNSSVTNGDVDGLSCDTVSQYAVTKTDVLVDNPFNNPTIVGYNNCVTSSGNIQALSD